MHALAPHARARTLSPAHRARVENYAEREIAVDRIRHGTTCTMPDTITGSRATMRCLTLMAGRDHTTRAGHKFKRSIVLAVRAPAPAVRAPFADRCRAQLAAIAGAPRAGAAIGV